MGKFRKMLAGVLSAAMVLSTMTVTAFAETTTTTPATIDTTKTGSITIHKYEYNELGGEAGTGETTDANKVPREAKALKGAGFTIYKVANVNDLTKYYKANPENLPSVDDYLTNGKINNSQVLETKSEVKTDNDGIAKFDNLALGFYVVVETTTPDKVTTPVKPFIVSVPMTTKDGDNWLYDVHVYPKNKTTYGGVTLEKTGKDGTKLEGVTFVLQKQNGDKWDNVTTSESDNKPLNLITNDEGQITVNGLSQGTYRFIETNRGDNVGYIMDGATTYVFTVNPDGTITYNGQTEKNITITVNNEKPSLEKSVKNADGSYDNDTDASVGDTVTWKVEASVPSNVNELKTYKLTDTMSAALTWENVANADLQISTSPSIELIQGTDYNLTVPEDNTKGGTWTIEFTETGKTKLATSKVKVITVTFNTKLNENAKIGSAGNLNDAELDYSNAIYPTEDPNNPNNNKQPGEDKITDQAIVYSFQMNVLKVDGKTSAGLEGVKFDLYSYTGEKTNPTEADLKGADGKRIAQDLKTDANGKIQYKGLKNGTYYLVETKTVKTEDGKQYNLLKEPVKVEITVEYTTKTETTITKDENGNVTNKTTVSTDTFTGGDTGSDGTFTVTVKNYTGFDLPTTGGMGTVLFSIAGFALMAGAAFVLLKGRRKDA